MRRVAEETKVTENETEETKADSAKAKETTLKKEKKSKKDSEIEKLKAELEQKNDVLLRTAAEFDNYKKRTEREKSGVAEYA
ncbi:MAG: nucleotide exchange factor GrpE, partial [Acutalibacteraceae bacterium]|nr:nucleotide exchange factor GrpE [Acutalibacteraceae bacterium]